VEQMKVYVYYRVSTVQQDTDRQQEAIKSYIKSNKLKITATFEDKASAKNFEREQYQALKSVIKSGDTLIIKELDRLGRNYTQIKEELQEFKNRGVKVIILDLPMLNSIQDPLLLEVIQDIIINLMGYIAQKEREKLQTRVNEGLKVAREKGIRLGRPERQLPKDFKKYYKKWSSREISGIEFAKLMKLSRSSLYRYIHQYERTLPTNE